MFFRRFNKEGAVKKRTAPAPQSHSESVKPSLSPPSEKKPEQANQPEKKHVQSEHKSPMRKVHEKKADNKLKKKKKTWTKKELLEKKRLTLEQAGFAPDVKRYQKTKIQLAVAFTVIFIGLALFFLNRWEFAGTQFRNLALLVLFAAPFLMYGFTLVAAKLYLEYRIYNRSKEVEVYLPDYLQLCALNIKAGMPVDKALWLSVRPKFGVLAEEMEIVAKRTITGVELPVALNDLTQKFRSATLERAISLLNAGIEAGGEIGDLLNKISSNIQETAIMKKEMAASVTTYAIFISFATIVAAPVLMALSAHLLEIVQGLAGSLGSDSGSVSGASTLSISPDTIDLGDYQIFAMLALTMTCIFSSIIISVIKKGNSNEAYASIPAMVGTAIALFFFSKWVLGSMLGGII